MKIFGPDNLVTNKQNFRSANTPQGTVIFPFPPIKGKKWLIVINEEENLASILKALNEGKLLSPLEDRNPYNEGGLHIDGQTPLFFLKNENLHS